MSFKKFLFVPLLIAVMALVLQVIDQLIRGYVEPAGNQGFTWISFQAWAVYFFAGCTPKGGLKALIGYALGILLSISIIKCAGLLGALGFWTVPAAIFILVIPVMCLERVPWLDLIPAIFIGSGAFFAFITYVPNATLTGAAATEMIYSAIGLLFGYVSVVLRGKYEKAILKK